MPGDVPNPCPIYRIGHIDNLSAIVGEGGMWCGAEMSARELPYKQIGLQGLTTNRKEKSVPCGEGGNLTDYVPWHFCPRSVMLYQIHTGFSDYKEGQEPILHFVTTVEKVSSLGLHFAFTDRHAKTSYAQFFDDLSHLPELDWPVIQSPNFARTNDEPDRPYIKEAEFLIHRFVPLEAIVGIGVHSQRYKDDCDRILEEADVNIKVKVYPRWYY